MPVYEVSHIIPLNESQRDALATAITRIHTELFTAPALFVNIHFTDGSSKVAYVGGKRKSTNHITATVRHGPSRSKQMYDQLCASIHKAWTEIVGTERDAELRAIFVMGSIVAGWEVGFPLPAAGEDRQWLRSNMEEFEKKAKDGDEQFKELVEEVARRRELREGEC